VTSSNGGAQKSAIPLLNSNTPATDNASDGPSRTAPANATASAPKGQNLFAFLVAAITAGFVALATPCVFPMIPITVAFFLKQEEKQAGSSLRLAIVYCLSIIFAFTILGLAMARIFGGTSLTSLANNPWLNVFFSILFVVFALMLLGLFEFCARTGCSTGPQNANPPGGFWVSSSWHSPSRSCPSPARLPSSARCWSSPPRRLPLADPRNARILNRICVPVLFPCPVPRAA
jgi:thiol:disulfide interchange protein